MSYIWIPAGTGNNTYGGVSIYVKLKKRVGPFKEENHVNGFKVYLEDRELFITRAGYKDYNYTNKITGYDYCIDADLNGNGSSVKHNSMMLTYTNKLSKRRYCIPKPDTSNGRFVIADSGGFQLFMGTEDFVDPRDLCDFANKYCTRTMCLDVPYNDMVNEENRIRCAEVQKLNIDLMLENLNKDVILYNINHGFTYEGRVNHHNIVKTPNVNHYAIGCSYYGNVHDFIYNVMSVISMITADSYHVFGVGNVLLIPILAWIGKYVSVTSDSSSHLQSGRCSVMFNIHGNRFKKVNMGRLADEILQSSSVHPYVTCNCPICTAINGSEIYYHSNLSNVTHTLNILHNINALTKYSDIWNNFAQTLSIEEYFKKLCKIVPNKERYFWKEAIYFINNILEMGLDKASNRNISNLSIFRNEGIETFENKGLFSKQEEDNNYEAEFNDYIFDVTQRYFDWHKDNNIRIEKQKKLIIGKQTKSNIGISTSDIKIRKGRK